MKDRMDPALETFKPDAARAAARWEAYWNGDLVDRPVLLAELPRPGYPMCPSSDYRSRVFGDMDAILADHLWNCAGIDYLGESMPYFWISFGTHEIANFCGCGIRWPDDPRNDTNWSEPFVEDWERSLPLRLDEGHPLWVRMQEFYRRAEAAFAGRCLVCSPDFHTNMDLLLSARGDAELCLDAVDRPDLVDRAMEDARRIFAEVWDRSREMGRMDAHGYWSDVYSVRSCTTLACDFAALIGPEMFRRWVLPTLESEASRVDRVRFHWDGPAALRHFEDLMGVERLHTVSFVPDPGVRHGACLDLYQRVQARGKAVEFSGTPDEIRAAHRALDPAKTIYRARVTSAEEFHRLDAWLIDHT